MIKNEYKIFDDYFVLYITRRNGDLFETCFDIDDFDFIYNLNSKIFVYYCKNNKSYYARITKYLGMDENGVSTNKGLLLHRLIMGVGDSRVTVDHKDFNTLNNRKYNLRVTSYPKNSKNRKSRNKNNKTGYRNVCRSGNWLYVQWQVDGKSKSKRFSLDQLEEAGKYAEEMRKKHYGEFAGSN